MLILIVDDDVEVSESLAAVLEKEGHRVLKSYTAKDGLKLATIEEPDAVFLDILLPDKDGLEVLKEIKSINREMTVVMITGFKDAEKVIGAFREGAFDCLLKPFNFDYLKNNVLPRIPLRKR